MFGRLDIDFLIVGHISCRISHSNDRNSFGAQIVINFHEFCRISYLKHNYYQYIRKLSLFWIVANKIKGYWQEYAKLHVYSIKPCPRKTCVSLLDGETILICILNRNVIFNGFKILWQLSIEVEIVHEKQVVVPFVVLGALLCYSVH